MPLLTKITQDDKAMLFLAILAGVSVLFLLTISVRNGLLEHPEKRVLDWFHDIRNPAMNRFFNIVTWLGSLWLLLPAALTLIAGLLFYNHRFEAVVVVVSFGGAIITTYVIKFALDRTRPEFPCTMGSLPPDPAFPSGHTTQAFAFALTVWLISYSQNLQWKAHTLSILLTVASLVALSRLYLRVHFPSDVLAGILVAFLWAGLTLYIIQSRGLT